MGKEYYFSINLSYQLIMSYYQGRVSNIQINTETGLRLQLPATYFRPFITHTGLQGRFRLLTDQNNKFVRLDRV